MFQWAGGSEKQRSFSRAWLTQAGLQRPGLPGSGENEAALLYFPGLPVTGLFLPELGYTKAPGRPAVTVWDLNLAFSAGLGQLKETRSHFVKKTALRRVASFFTQHHLQSLEIRHQQKQIITGQAGLRRNSASTIDYLWTCCLISNRSPASKDGACEARGQLQPNAPLRRGHPGQS